MMDAGPSRFELESEASEAPIISKLYHEPIYDLRNHWKGKGLPVDEPGDPVVSHLRGLETE